MSEKKIRNIRLGIFVITGTALLIASLYLMGNKQNLFGNVIRISAQFYDVNGLMEGNNVRFSGIDVGTVEKVEIINDSSVNVIMIIEEKTGIYIKKNAVASIGTDGLMGNKLVNINASGRFAKSIENGDVLATIRPIEQDAMIRTLNATNENMKVITSNLRTITDKINSKNSLWSLLLDTVVAENVKSAIVTIKMASDNTLLLTGNLASISGDIISGKGTLGALITDTSLYRNITQTVVTLRKAGDTTLVVSGNISQIVRSLQQGKGSLGVLLNDTMLVHNINNATKSINKTSNTANEDLEALKHSVFLRKYFKKSKNKK